MRERVTSAGGTSRSLPPGVPATYPYPDVPVTRLLDDAAKDFPETDAIDAAGHRLTYREVVDQVDRLATGLRGLGIEHGDRVGLLLPHCPQFLIALFATLRAGATTVVLRADAPDLEQVVNATGCRALVCLSTAYPRLQGLKGRLSTVRHILATGHEDYLPFPRNIVSPLTGRRDGTYRRIPRGEGVAGLKDLIRRTAPEPIAVSADAPAVVCDRFVFDHAALVAGAFQLRLWVPDAQAGRERLLVAAEPASSFGIGVLLGLGVLTASTLVFPARPGPLASRAARRSAPTLLAAHPEALTRLAGDDGALDSLRVGLADGSVDASASDSLHEATGARIRGGLAVVGACGLVHANPVYGRAKPGSAGLALTDTRSVALGDDGKPLPAGEVGTIAVQGPQVASRQWIGAAAAPADLAGPWLRTERRGHLDADGYLWPERSA